MLTVAAPTPASAGGGGDPRGQILPITIADHGSSDFAGLAPPPPLTPPCTPVPLDTVIDHGNFTVS